jgi:hypothetical protein
MTATATGFVHHKTVYVRAKALLHKHQRQRTTSPITA